MFDALSYPVSLVMKVLHDLLGLFASPDSGLIWLGSIVLLVVTVRLILLRPAWKQMWSARRTAQIQPQMGELKRQHGSDQQAYLQAVQALQRREGISLAAGCLPLLIQMPVLFGLYHLLADFTVTAGGGGNGIFTAADVTSFAHATMLGVPLSAAIRTPAETLSSLAAGLTTAHVAMIVLPLLIIAAAATFVNLWRTQRRQPATPIDAGNPMAASLSQVSKMMLWVAPIGLLVSGIAFPIPLALVFYWAVNGTWTTVQTQIMTARLDRTLPLPAPAQE